MSDDPIFTNKAIAEYLGISVRGFYNKAPALRDAGVILQRTIRIRCRDGKYRNFRVNYTLPSLLRAYQVRRGGI